MEHRMVFERRGGGKGRKHWNCRCDSQPTKGSNLHGKMDYIKSKKKEREINTLLVRVGW